MKVISGGQTGADLAGVITAKKVGFETGGTMPLGFRNLSGKHPEYAEIFGMKEHSSYEYAPRTECNVVDSDGTIRIATDFRSPGEKLTLRLINKYNKPHLDVTPEFTPWPLVYQFVIDNKIKVLNIAGNSEKTSRGIQAWATGFLEQPFKELKRHLKWEDS